mmetsp:Transcript_96/g.118  ORF Transcript_96/g.118 Transcript_96/m.118 type:complete len:433 (-) Transcript_96:214-1512(-)|eukprot:CAMPEP_0198148590 /NCGR_PEP_ID=MMETSP1443-20131203/42164_1 /TAXON_ID=186043 /ORGANISM="Entomoneis sp., Strain CCMP2396" /LENGTH=432 /DNA_ID=CAMNT_0043813309 /DNA_START=43 /DNA_END=1341 /DNA_ORIENTATION=-
MSRAALWRQEGNVKEREMRAEEIFETVVEEGRQKSCSNSILPLWGPDSTFHFNPLLLRNIIHSPYFQKCCEKLLDWNAVIDEIYYEVKSLQPFSNDKAPSTAFCLILRLLTLRMTDHQLDLTLKHPDSPYIRGIGFLYLRYAGMPEQIMGWVEPYLFDEEEFTVEPGHRAPTTTMGEFVLELFRSRDYHGTPLPRFPLDVERKIQVRMLQAEKVAERAAYHFKNQERMAYFQALGSEVMALYGDDENLITWYKAVVDRVITREDSGFAFKYPKFVVTFTEYGNTETVTLGEMDTLQGRWRNGDLSAPSQGGGERRGGNRNPERGDTNNNDRDLYGEVLRRERNTATADKGWARRPPTTKNALSAHTQHRGHSLQDVKPKQHLKPQPGERELSAATAGGVNHDSTRGDISTKRSAEATAVIKEKKRKLLAKYG